MPLDPLPPAPPTIDALPPAPTPTMPTPAFKAAAFVHVAALEPMRVQQNAQAAAVNLLAGHAYASAQAADESRADAEAAAAHAESAANVTKWVSGTLYNEGDTVWSPLNAVTYRRRTTGGGAVDPSIDYANWALPNAANLPVQRIGANTVAQWGIHYVFEAACTLTLPVAGANKDAVIRISNASGLSSGCLMDFGAGKLRGASPGLMNISDRYFSETLQDTGSPTIGYTA